MRRKSFQDMNCSVAQALEVVGEWWTMLIVRDCLLGVTRFDDFQERLGIARNVLTERLDHLVARGVLRRVAYQDHPPRHDYRLTEKGRDLWLVVNALRQWGDRWEAGDGPPVVVEHLACGRPTTIVPTCAECAGVLDARSLRALPGPGASERPSAELGLLTPAR
ncbi:MAG: helix-turn-helix domain-containing protein [Candidatus Dormiibacterota bacterium]